MNRREDGRSGRIAVVVHQEHSDPGRIGAALSGRGYALDIRRHACGDPLPDRLDDYDGVVVFGGPMSANDDHLDFIRSELAFVERVAASDTRFLGVCLGAQLMARARGARVCSHPDKLFEIGYVEIAPTQAGRDWFDRPLNVYQWHGEGFDLPDDAVALACGEVFRNQAAQFSPRGLGIQFHPEVTGAMMRRWQVKAAHRLVEPGAQPAEAQCRDWVRHDAALAHWLEGFLDRWLAT